MLTYEALLDLFWASHNPTRAVYSRQYMPAVFFEGEAHSRAALASKEARARGGRAMRTVVVPLTAFYRAEDYHQKYHLRHDALLLREFAGRTARELTDSTVAARLNGYVAGFGDASALDELGGLGLSPEAERHVRSLLEQNARRGG